MATPFSRQLKTFEDLEKELQYFGKSNVSALQKYAASVPSASINDGTPAENKERPIDIPRALSLQPTVEAYEKSSFIKRWWLWLATDISNMRTAYYYARATLILKTLHQQQPLSANEHQFITQGVRQHNRFSTLGSIYRALNSKTQLGLTISPKHLILPNALLINNALPKSITLLGRVLNWLGFNQVKATVDVTSMPDEVNKNPSIAKHAEFKTHFDEYKNSLKKLISDLEVITSRSQKSPKDTTSLITQLNDLKKKERGLMTMTHPDKNLGDYQATAKANFQRLQSFIDWKTNMLEKVINSIENTEPQGRNITASIAMLEPYFNSLNEFDDHQHQAISQLLLNKQKTDEMVERIKKEYDQIRDEHHKKAEAAKKSSQRYDEIMRKLDAENAELRRNLQLRKIAVSLQTATNPQEAPIASANNNADSSQTNPDSTSKSDGSARPYFKTGQPASSGSDSMTSSREIQPSIEIPTPIS